jgi:hypothetical protein
LGFWEKKLRIDEIRCNEKKRKKVIFLAKTQLRENARIYQLIFN